MYWYLWMMAGAAATVAAFFLGVYLLNVIDDERWAREHQIQERRSASEQNMQRIVQDTISKMFEATRGHR
ncbi:MAG TPA: hypothetical protein VHO01_07930 [Jatrophihabitans sp.]|nr:hypothetical protein [Jatrophihabitans sp.]